jgi:hypothetical protein
MTEIDKKAFYIFLEDKHKKILKSINIDNKILGINKIDKNNEIVKIKGIYLWNNMIPDMQLMYINKVKKTIDLDYDFKNV